jgi:mRNA-degrading endonuclease toxin of MazEF toxin-antitoxin module
MKMNETSSMVNKKIPKVWEFWVVKFKKSLEDKKELRPCLVISNDWQNEFDQGIIVIPLTTKALDLIEPFEVLVKKNPDYGIDRDCKLQFNYPKTVNKISRLYLFLGKADNEIIEKSIIAWKKCFFHLIIKKK